MEELNWKYWYTDVDKDKNQYTYEECNRIGPVDAKYVKSSNKDFNGNPFIEALPRPRDGKELIMLIRVRFLLLIWVNWTT